MPRAMPAQADGAFSSAESGLAAGQLSDPIASGALSGRARLIPPGRLANLPTISPPAQPSGSSLPQRRIRESFSSHSNTTFEGRELGGCDVANFERKQEA